METSNGDAVDNVGNGSNGNGNELDSDALRDIAARKAESLSSEIADNIKAIQEQEGKDGGGESKLAYGDSVTPEEKLQASEEASKPTEPTERIWASMAAHTVYQPEVVTVPVAVAVPVAGTDGFTVNQSMIYINYTVLAYKQGDLRWFTINQ